MKGNNVEPIATDNKMKFFVWRAHKKLRQELGRNPSIDEIADECGISYPYAVQIIRELKTCKTTNLGASRIKAAWKASNGLRNVSSGIDDLVTFMKRNGIE